MKVLLAALILALAAACSDDPAQTPTNNMDMDTTDAQDDSGQTGGDMSEADMSEPEPDMAEDMPAEEDMAEDMAPEPDMMADMEADMDPVDPPLPFTWPADPTAFANTSTDASYIYELLVPETQDGVAVCCKDFGAISKAPGIDNALANLNDTLAIFGADIQAPLTDAIENGSAVILLDHRELDGATDPDGFLLSWLAGSFANGTDYGSAAASNGQFTLLPAAFKPGTGEPLVVFNPASMMANEMAAGPTSLDFSLPFLGSTLSLAIQQAEVSGTATVPNDGIAYTDGALSGWVTLESMYTAINTIIDQNCACIGNTQPIYTQDATNQEWEGACVANVNTVCPSNAEEICRVLAGSNIQNGGVCGLLPSILQGAADIDADNDDNFEALSIGFEWSAARADIVP